MGRLERKEVILMGDCNGHVGILGEEIHRNEELVIKFMESCEHENLNLSRGSKHATWERRGQKVAIDFRSWGGLCEHSLLYMGNHHQHRG